MSNPYDPSRPENNPEPIDDLMIRDDDEGDDAEQKGSDRERISSSMRDTLHRIPESLSSIGRDISRTIERAISAKDDYVVAVKLTAAAQDKLDQLVQAGVFRSRAEAAAFLIDEGTKAQAELFARVEQKLSEIERLRAELRGMVSKTE
jgi:Arc/MetJ-type ribon-helix-helix transcriptional regulator